MQSNEHLITRLTQYMKRLNAYSESIKQLQSVWDNLTLLAQLSATGTDMTQTRIAFNQVTQNVLRDLSREMLNKTISALSSKAFVIINIVVRNLFERTADIGFLATDDDVRKFLLSHRNNEASETDFDNLRVRFREYVSKYSVYDNIVLLDTSGNVLVQLDECSGVTTSQDPLIREAIKTNAPYIEAYRHSDLLPGNDKSLIYAYRVKSLDNQLTLGVLCLCFRFENEMSGVFDNQIAKHEWVVGVMLDETHHVIASSDEYQIPLGAQLEVTHPEEDWALTRFAGREYISVTRRTQGYQGYMGPGWMGHAMIPLEYAFDSDIESVINGLDASMLAKVMRSPLLFSESLLNIPKDAAMIQSKLNQSVWNGNIWETRNTESQQNHFSKLLLWEISNTGFKTQQIIEDSVAELYQTAVSVMLENSRFFAFLAVDIMDRNLYERANDCRWWALTSTFKKVLQKSQISASDVNQLTKIISYINDLYTVYDNIVLFDRQGKIIAVSNPSYRDCIDTVIDSEWVGRVRLLKTSQDYVVSKFERTVLYKDKPTYIYAAPIRSEDNAMILGGVGIVFDSQPQFLAILNDVLPRDNNGKAIKDSFTLFVDGDLKVISSTLDVFETGSDFSILPSLCKLPPGQSSFDIALYNGKYYAVGACASIGYREYKGKDDSYRNHVTALIFIPLGDAAEIDAMIEADQSILHNQFTPSANESRGKNSIEYATFYVGSDWLGIPATSVLEATEPVNIRPLPNSTPILEGLFKYKDDFIPIINMSKLSGSTSKIPLDKQQIVVLNATDISPTYGILVSALGEIPSIETEKIEPIQNVFANRSQGSATGITRVPGNNGNSKILTLLSADNIWTSAS